VVDGVYSSGKYQVLAINRGKRDGLVPGNAVAVFSGGDMVMNRGTDNRWRKVSSTYETVRLPKERSGTLLLFSVHDRVSYGLVVESTQALRRGDYLKHPAYGHRDAGLSTYSP
jgi:hypothetical protein